MWIEVSCKTFFVFTHPIQLAVASWVSSYFQENKSTADLLQHPPRLVESKRIGVDVDLRGRSVDAGMEAENWGSRRSRSVAVFIHLVPVFAVHSSVNRTTATHRGLLHGLLNRRWLLDAKRWGHLCRRYELSPTR